MEHLKKTLFVSEKNKLWMKKEHQYKKNRSRNNVGCRSLIISLFIFVYMILQLRYDSFGENSYNSNNSNVRNRDRRILSESLSNTYEYDYDNDSLNVEESDDSSSDLLEDFNINSNSINDNSNDNIDENINLMSFIEVTEVLNDGQNTPPESNADYVVTEVNDDIIDEEEDKRLKEEYERIVWKRRGISGSHKYHILTSSCNEFNSNRIINEKTLDHIELLHNEMDPDSYNVLRQEDEKNINSLYINEKHNNNNNNESPSKNIGNTYELPNEELHNNSDGLTGSNIVNMNLYFNGDMYSSLENLEETVDKINDDDEEEFEKMLDKLKNNGTLGETCKVWNKFCSIEKKKFYNMQMNLWKFCEILAFEYKIPQSTLANEWKKIVTYTNEELFQKNLTDFLDFNTLVFNKIYDVLDFIHFIINKRESCKQFRESEERVWKNTLEKNFENYVR